jgi:predicted nucleic acid-binding protein
LPIIFDITVLRNFAVGKYFHALEKLYQGRAFICRSILTEVQAGIERDRQYHQLPQLLDRAIEESWLRFSDYEVNPNDEILELKMALEYDRIFCAGEAETIATACSRDWKLATDDGKVRKISQKHGIKSTGSLGILIKATQQEIIGLTDADAFHARMIDAGYKSPLSYKNGISEYF